MICEQKFTMTTDEVCLAVRDYLNAKGFKIPEHASGGAT
jgi:hypothetical protein